MTRHHPPTMLARLFNAHTWARSESLRLYPQPQPLRKTIAEYRRAFALHFQLTRNPRSKTQ